MRHAEYRAELNRINVERGGLLASQKDELARIRGHIRAIMDAIKEGLRTTGMKDELFAFEARKTELEKALKRAPLPAPLLHPALADIYR
jgi:site-specific DNA recombinase